MPPKLTTLLLFTVRYTAVLRQEYARLRRAMDARCFAPRPNGHTLRSLGHLVGMLLVRGFERSERILGAMKCRGYSGRVPLAAVTSFGWRDFAFGALVVVVVSGLTAVQFA
jgi:cobalt/nickel transport system permease protein